MVNIFISPAVRIFRGNIVYNHISRNKQHNWSKLYITQFNGYVGELKRFNGVNWEPTSIKHYNGITFETKPLKIFIGGNWHDVKQK